ncbi:MAG: preprotein translocase subunit SecE [Gemmataceae bacterium]|nr:preprotein translocase subunit SecE [Gemmataceae bacterium]
MATAVETSSQPRVPSRPANLALAGLAGAVYVLAALAVVFYAVPALWAEYVAPALPPALGWVGDGFRVAVQAAAFVGLVLFGRSLAGANPPVGLRGGIFLTITAACLVFFLTRAVGLWAGGVFDGATGQVVTAAVGLALVVLLGRLLAGPRGTRWMVGLEEQGWFHAAPYKRALGRQVRRLTLLGILLVGATGVYALINQGQIPEEWTLALPFTQADGAPEGTHRVATVIPNARLVVPAVLLAAAVWVAYRAVNLPAFAEFLIATEAEMNKVSWSSRRRLFQDTVVVLVTTILMALFLLAVDLFWGWLLSLPVVGVLPGKTPGAEGNKPVQEAKW